MAIVIYIGAVGSGKTTICAMLAHKAMKRNRKVYSNVDEIEGVIPISADDIGKFNLHDGLLLFDEAGIEYNNRLSVSKKSPSSGQYKGMTQDAIKWFKLSRHFKVDVVIFSQAQDFDVTLRRLASKIFIVRKSLIPCFSSYKRLAAHWVTDQSTGDPRLEWTFVPFSTRWVFRPRYYKYFNSYNVPDLPMLERDIDDKAWSDFLDEFYHLPALPQEG